MVPVILIAAGDWRSLRKPVSILPWGSVTVIEHILDIISHSSASPVIVVLGHEAWSIRKKIEGCSVQIVVDDWHKLGLPSWIRCGLRAIPAEAQAVIIASCDQPAVPASVFDGLIEAHRSSGRGMIVPSYSGRRGRPVLFDLGRYGHQLLALGPGAALDEIAEQSPGDVLEMPVATPAVVTDISAERPLL